MRNLVTALAAFGLVALTAPAVSATPSLNAQVETLHDNQIAFVKKGGKGWKGGRAWGRSHNRGRHLGWNKQHRWR